MIYMTEYNTGSLMPKSESVQMPHLPDFEAARRLFPGVVPEQPTPAWLLFPSLGIAFSRVRVK